MQIVDASFNKIKNQGFTLLEIIITLMILMITIAIAVPVGRNTLDYLRIKSTADEIKRTIKLAQSKAMADPQVHCGVYFFSGTGSSASYAKKEIAIFFDINGNNRYENGSDKIYLAPKPLGLGIKLIIPSAVNGGITDNVIVFRGDGSAKTGGAVVINSPLGRRDSIHTLASTGRVKVYLSKK